MPIIIKIYKLNVSEIDTYLFYCKYLNRHFFFFSLYIQLEIKILRNLVFCFRQIRGIIQRVILLQPL